MSGQANLPFWPVKGPQSLTDSFCGCERDKKTSWFSNLLTYKQMVHQQQFEIDARVPFIN